MSDLPPGRAAEILMSVAEQYRGERNGRLSNGTESRYGKRGSLAIRNDGRWYDHEEGTGGESPVGLMMHLASVDKSRALELLGHDYPEFRRDRIGGGPWRNRYPYRDREGRAVKYVNRENRPDGSKRVWQESADSAEGVTHVTRCIYRYPTIAHGIENGETILIVEGEKCADALLNAGLYATTNDQGAGSWAPEHTRCLLGAGRVVILPDNDEPGRKHAGQVADGLGTIGIAARILELPGLPDKGDVVDWLDAGHTVRDLEAEIEALYSANLPPSLTAFSAIPFPPMETILGPFTTQQINLIFAPAGAGKTMLGLSIAYAIAEGNPFLGWLSGGARRVLYVDAEMSARMIQERFGEARSDRLFIANLHGWGARIGLDPVNIATEAGQALLSEWVRELNAPVLFLDNFMTLAWRDGTSFSSDEIWTPVRRWCLEMRGEGKTVFIVDHANAQGQVFGTKTKTHQVDLTAVLEPIKAEDFDPEPAPAGDSRGPNHDSEGVNQRSRAVLRFEKKRGYAETDSRVADKEVILGSIGSPWEWKTPGDALTEDISAYRQDGLSLREIAKEMNVSYSKIQRTWRRHQAGDSR